MIGLAHKRLASTYLFFLSFAESSFFPIPPDTLLMPLCLGKREKALKFAFICTVGSVLGGLLGYGIGFWLWKDGESGLALFAYKYVPGFSLESYLKIKELFSAYDFWIVFTAGFTPIPYKLITITAGACDINFFMFIIASTLSRGARFFLVAGLIKVFGAKMEQLIERYFNWFAFGFMALLIGGFAVIKLFLKH